ncbi:BppU family phage baseplate upper protein [Staphylococcus equorum]|uniref:BppU family phage baseplate upper protein n=1 Tax=Staphylococcus equorum TaxID=246432 RepID=UPI0025538E64|nr:BppU family phage baseplate upper protein [Staphylococcus equorum]MDK9851025.1 BppU family phage baseplate upper protein [Staphylococcus equorum]
MVSNLDKKVIINMENTAKYQTRSKLNIAFSTADRDSAVFVFNVTKDNKPMLLSNENVTGHIALKHSDESFVKDTLHFTEPDINGRFEYYIPNDILKRQGTVTMQVFISEKGNSNVTVAERIVSFDIQESIVSQISAETKLQYIVEYDELQAIIANRITDIEDKMANAEDYVSQLEQAREKGLSDIEIARSTSIQEINTLVANKIQELETKGNQYSTKFDNDKAEMDSKKEAFDLAVQGSNVVTTNQSSNWQKYRFTNNDGTLLRLDLNSSSDVLYAANIGSYYATGVPINNASSTAGLLTIEMNIPKNVKFITFRPFNSTQIWLKRFYTEWSSWEIVGVDPTKTETTTGSQDKANIAESNAKIYAKDLVDKKANVLFEGTANGVGTSINLNETLDNFIVVFVFGSTPGGSFVECADPQGSNDFVFEKTNVIGVDGSESTAFECIIQKVSRTNLKIISDTFHGVSSSTGSGPNANKFTINKIIGVRK